MNSCCIYPSYFNNFMISIYNMYINTKNNKIHINSDIESNKLFQPPTPNTIDKHHKRSFTLSESEWEEIN